MNMLLDVNSNILGQYLMSRVQLQLLLSDYHQRGDSDETRGMYATLLIRSYVLPCCLPNLIYQDINLNKIATLYGRRDFSAVRRT
jgi:hypothetical protein